MDRYDIQIHIYHNHVHLPKVSQSTEYIPNWPNFWAPGILANTTEAARAKETDHQVKWLYSIDTVDWTKTTKICAHKKATTQTNLHPHKATTPDSMDCSKSLAIQRCYTSDPQSNTHMLQLGPLLLLFDPVRLALPGLMLLLASHMKLCRSQPILCLRLFLHTIQSICTKKLSVAGNDIVHSRAIYIIIVNGLCILGLKGGKATVVVWPLHIEPSTRNVKTEADGVLDPSLRQWVKRLIQRCLHMMSAPSV